MGYDCLGRPQATQIVSYPNPASCGRLPPSVTIERRTFDVYQLRQSSDIVVHTCKLTISRFVGRCSMPGWGINFNTSNFPYFHIHFYFCFHIHFPYFHISIFPYFHIHFYIHF